MKKEIICYLLFFISRILILSGESPSWEEYKQETFHELPLIPGWCHKEKAEKLMSLIYETRPEICVEIGTFAGSSTYPIARALRFLGKGVIYTIDAWDNKACIEGLDPNHSNIVWWSSLELNATREQFIFMIFKKQLTTFCYPIFMRSERAHTLFADHSIDFLYIDGNFSRQGSIRDVLAYFPKVKPEGLIWLNDADSIFKNKAVAYLMKNCQWVKEKSLGKSSLVFKKN